MTTRSDSFNDHIEQLYSVYQTYDYYRILGILPNDPVEKIKKAFFNVELRYHPDMYLMIDESIEKKLFEIFSYINDAYVTLTDPLKRREYDLAMEKSKAPSVVPPDTPPAALPVQDDRQQNTSGEESPAPATASEDNKHIAKLKFRDGKIAFWDNDFGGAARLFELAGELDGSAAEYHFMYGRALGRLGKNKEAVRALNRANELKPSDPDTLVELGYIYLNLGFPRRADKYFKQVIGIDPANKKAKDGIKKAR